MRYGSVCSGIEAATAAWHPLGWEPQWFSEIEPFPSAVLKHHYPKVHNYGDFTGITADAPAIDVLVGGTPCQSFSVAGLRGGLDDDRGNLALEFCRLADRLRPRWIVWENVPGVLSSAGGRDFGSILGALAELGYGTAYRVLDAQYFGVPQRRRRVFVVGYLGDWRRAAAVLFERHSLSGDSAPRRKAGERAPSDIAPSLTSSGRGVERAGDSRGQDCVIPIAFEPHHDEHAGRGYNFKPSGTHPELRGPHGCDNTLIASTGHTSHCLNAGGMGRIDYESETLVTATMRSNGDAHSGFRDEQGLVTHALRGEGFDASEDGTGRGTPLVPIAFETRFVRNGRGAPDELVAPLKAQSGQTGKGDAAPCVATGSAVRRLTPLECERLQGFSDHFTAVPYRGKVASDGPRYKALGNSMAVPVMSWIGERIQAVHNG